MRFTYQPRRLRAAVIAGTTLAVAAGSLAYAGTATSRPAVTSIGTPKPAVAMRADPAGILKPGAQIRGMFLWKRQHAASEMIGDLPRLKADGVNTIAVYIMLETSKINGSDVTQRADVRTGRDAVAVIKAAHRIGLAINLVPYIQIPATHSWHGYLNPTYPKLWFSNYRKILRKYEDLAERNNVELFTIGTELYTLQQDRFVPHWKELVAEARRHFHGKLTYTSSIGGDAALKMTWWNLVDYIGVSPYYTLSSKPNPPVNALVQTWKRSYFPGLKSLSTKFNRKVLFGELGYTSNSYTAYKPATVFRHGIGERSPQAQANAYQALFEATKGQTWYTGVQWFHWTTQRNPRNTDFDPRDKLAECIIAKYWKTDVNPAGSVLAYQPALCWSAHVRVG
ncbi:MAG: hypothetical protein QOG53_743 [Frankiales bacterium]|jgi:hypothetical protein|nr:hypothetical protein [Frankiales bacterium]